MRRVYIGTYMKLSHTDSKPDINQINNELKDYINKICDNGIPKTSIIYPYINLFHQHSILKMLMIGSLFFSSLPHQMSQITSKIKLII